VQTEYYMHDPGAPGFNPATDEVLFSQTDGVYATLTDHLGTVHDLVNQASTVVNHFVYDAFGNMVGGTAQVHWRNRIGFAGAFFEAATGLQYNHHRWYDAAAGRWISEDPIGFDGGDSNLNRYVGNQVTTQIDPSGLQGAAGPFTDDKLASLRSAYRNEVLSSYMANRNPMSWPNYLDSVQRPGESARAPEYTGPCMGATDPRMTDYWDWRGRLKNGRYTSADLDRIIGADRGIFERGVFEPGGGFDALVGLSGRGGGRTSAARRASSLERGIRNRGANLGRQQGREFRGDQLGLHEFDANAPSHVRGWLCNERRRVDLGQAAGPRVPPGYELGHGRSTPAREGFDYSNSRLQGTDLNRLEERIRRNQGRP
jgi:RHS repeat-associated protein